MATYNMMPAVFNQWIESINKVHVEHSLAASAILLGVIMQPYFPEYLQTAVFVSAP